MTAMGYFFPMYDHNKLSNAELLLVKKKHLYYQIDPMYDIPHTALCITIQFEAVSYFIFPVPLQLQPCGLLNLPGVLQQPEAS